MTSLQAPPSGRGGESSTFQWTVKNAGTVDAQQSWSDRVVLSQNNVIGDGDDVVLATVAHTGGLAAGAIYTGSAAAPVPLRLTGTWYVTVVADALGQVTEPDSRENNTLLPPAAITLTSPFADLQMEVAVAPRQPGSHRAGVEGRANGSPLPDDASGEGCAGRAIARASLVETGNEGNRGTLPALQACGAAAMGGEFLERRSQKHDARPVEEAIPVRLLVLVAETESRQQRPATAEMPAKLTETGEGVRRLLVEADRLLEELFG